MPLTKIKDRFQITIPSTIRRQLHLNVGDILETVVEDQHIVFKVKALVDRSPVPPELPKTPSLQDVDPDRPSDIERFLDSREQAMRGSARELRQKLQRLHKLGLVDDHGERTDREFPADMRDGSRTDV